MLRHKYSHLKYSYLTRIVIGFSILTTATSAYAMLGPIMMVVMMAGMISGKSHHVATNRDKPVATVHSAHSASSAGESNPVDGAAGSDASARNESVSNEKIQPDPTGSPNEMQ